MSTSATAADGVDRLRLYSRLAVRIVPILFIAQLISSLDRANVSFAGQGMSKALGLDAAAFGLGAGLFFIGYFVFEVPSNLLLERVGARLWFTRILATWGIATFLMAFVHTPWQFFLLRFLVGAAEAGLAPGVQWYFANWFPTKFRARINGAFLLAVPFSSIIGGPLSGWILTTFAKSHPFAGWQWLFLIEGVITVLMAPIVLFFLPDRPRNLSSLGERERVAIASDISEDVQHASSITIPQALKSPATLQLVITYFCILLGLQGITFWMPTILRNAGVKSQMATGWYSAIPFVVAVIVMPLVSLASDRVGKRRPFLIAGGIIAAAGLVVAGLFPHSLALSLVGLSMVAAGVLGNFSVFWALAGQRLVAAAATVGFAVINSFGNLAGFVAPYGIGLATTTFGGPAYALYGIAAFELLAVAIVAFFVKEHARAADIATPEAQDSLHHSGLDAALRAARSGHVDPDTLTEPQHATQTGENA